MHNLPSGTLTFFFSDIEGSTRMLESLGDRYSPVLERHREIVRTAVRAPRRRRGQHPGRFVLRRVSRGARSDRRRGGDPARHRRRAMAGRNRRSGSGSGCTRARRALSRATMWASTSTAPRGSWRPRTAARSSRPQSTWTFGQSGLDGGIELRDLGEHRLRDLSAPERLFQVIADGLDTDFPPLRTLDRTPNNLPTQPTILVGRDLELERIRRHLDCAARSAADADRPGRHRQDAPRAPGRCRPGRPRRTRRLLRGPVRRRGRRRRARRDREDPGHRDPAGRRPERRSWPSRSATRNSCWCSTTSSRSCLPRTTSRSSCVSVPASA